jgi:hypothetical protein
VVAGAGVKFFVFFGFCVLDRCAFYRLKPYLRVSLAEALRSQKDVTTEFTESTERSGWFNHERH